MNNRSVVRYAAAGTAALMAACAPAIRSQRDEAIPVPQGATWAWAGSEPRAPADTGAARPEGARSARGGAGPVGDPTALRAIPRQRLHRALAQALVAKGFREVPNPDDADFLLTLALEGPARPGAARRGSSVQIGVYGGRGPWGRARPWGFFGPQPYFSPWGGWLWQPWGFGWYAMPYWGLATAYPVAMAPRGMTVVALLRQRSDGQVAWRAQYRADAYDLAYLTQARAQEIADKLVASLR